MSATLHNRVFPAEFSVVIFPLRASLSIVRRLARRIGFDSQEVYFAGGRGTEADGGVCSAGGASKRLQARKIRRYGQTPSRKKISPSRGLE